MRLLGRLQLTQVDGFGEILPSLSTQEGRRTPPGFEQGALLRGALGRALSVAVRTSANKAAFEALFGAGSRGFAFAVSREPGAPLFSMKLFGAAAREADVVCEFLSVAGTLQLGRDRAPVRIDRVARREFDLAAAWGDATGVPCSLRLRPLSPLRLTRHGERVDALDPELLVVAGLRRVESLIGEPAGDRPELFGAAAAATVRSAQLRWHEASHFSQRQSMRVPLGGVVGEMTLDDVSPVLASFLRTIAIVQIGKGTSFGLGHFSVEEVPA